MKKTAVNYRQFARRLKSTLTGVLPTIDDTFSGSKDRNKQAIQDLIKDCEEFFVPESLSVIGMDPALLAQVEGLISEIISLDDFGYLSRGEVILASLLAMKEKLKSTHR